MIKTYSEFRRLDTFQDRFEYLKLNGAVGAATFGFDRHLNQAFYRSTLWHRTRQDVIARDLGCDLGFEGREIFDRVYVHHMNPMTVEDITHSNLDVLDPEFLICVTQLSHNLNQYGEARQIKKDYVAQTTDDTKPW